MTPIQMFVISVITLVLGSLVGWWFGRQQAALLRRERDGALTELEQSRSDCESWRARFNEAVVNLAAETEKTRRLNEVEGNLAAERQQSAVLVAELAGVRAADEERQRAHQAQMTELKEAREALTAQFAEIGGKLLGEAQDQFLKRANARFDEAGQRNEEKLKTLLQPVETTLKRYEEGLAKVEKEREGSYRELSKAVELLHAGHTAVKEETARLVNTLRASPKARGRWGEQSLKNVLEQAGLTEGVDFKTEVSVETGDGTLRPDVIINLPGGRKLIIDAKCSLNAYLDASDCVEESTRLHHLKLHAGSVRTHVQQLSSKAYWAQFAGSAEYVVLFIPGEHFLTAALEYLQNQEDYDLWQAAIERRVLLATPTNLVAIARTVASVWKQERLSEAADEIARLGKELHSRLATMGEHMKKVGSNLQTASTAYNQMVGSFESQVFTQARRFEALGAGSAKEIGTPPMIEASPRPLTKLVAPADEGTAEAAE